MTKLAFVIPAWNRPRQLEVCVESIASQVRPDDDVRIFIQDDCSDDPEMPGVLDRMGDKYQCVESYRTGAHGDYSDAFRAMFRAAPDAEWVWTFGDDDKLRPGALTFVLDELLPGRMESRDFLHVAEHTRSSGANAIIGADRLLDLCNELGWIEMTGFITGNLCRGSLLAQAAETPRWKKYATSAFVQSAALLEALHDRPCAFVDIPLVSTQNNEQSEDTTRRWVASNIPVRYMHAIDSIEVMFEDGILKNKLPAKFFRYLNYHLWDRFIVSMINDYANQHALWPEWAWDKTEKFAQFLADDAEAAQLRQDVDAARGMVRLGLYLEKNAEGIRNEVASIGERRSASVYPYGFIGELPPAA